MIRCSEENRVGHRTEPRRCSGYKTPGNAHCQRQMVAQQADRCTQGFRTHTHTHRHRHTDTQTHIHRHTYTHTDMHTETHTERHTHIDTHRHADRHTQTHRHTEIHTHTDTHTDTHTHLLSRFSHIRLFATLWTVPTRVPCPRDSPDKNTGVGCHDLLQGIFPTRGSGPSFLHLLH